MADEEIKIVLEKLVETVAFLCDETASLVDERARRELPEDQGGVRLKAEQIRASARSLRQALPKAG